MFAWILLIASAVFACLAWDAFRLASPGTDVAYAVTAKGLGQDVSHIPLGEQHELKRRNASFGLGDLNQSVWLFGVLCAGSLAGALVSFLG